MPEAWDDAIGHRATAHGVVVRAGCVRRMVIGVQSVLVKSAIDGAQLDGEAWPAARPRSFRRDDLALVHQQFWLFGCDIRRPEGNLLLELGFTRERPPQGVDGSSAYLLDRGAGRTLILWGFGLFVGEPGLGGIFVSRFRPDPHLMPQPSLPVSVWDAGGLPPRHKPRSPQEWVSARVLLVDALNWITGYEQWVQKTVGEPYRADCLDSWRRAVCTSCELPARWQDLANEMQRGS